MLLHECLEVLAQGRKIRLRFRGKRFSTKTARQAFSDFGISPDLDASQIFVERYTGSSWEMVRLLDILHQGLFDGRT